MSVSDGIKSAASRQTPLNWKQIVLLWLVVTLALLPVMAFLMASEREVSQYSTLSFEAAARAALEAGDYGRAVRVCTGALRVGLDRSDYWGLAHLLRAQAQMGAGNLAEALTDLRTAARLWTAGYYTATPGSRAEAARVGSDLAERLVESGDVEAARHAVSAAGVCSGRPVDYLHEQAGALSSALKGALWPEGPCLVLEDFQGSDAPVFATRIDEQGRPPLRAQSDAPLPGSTARGAALEVGASTKDGRTWYGVPAYIPLSTKSFALRVRVKEEQPSDLSVVVGYWFDLAHKSVDTPESKSTDVGGGWRVFDIRRDFYAERAAYAKKAGYDPEGGIINQINLSPKPGPANRYWIERIELYIPDTAK